MTSDEIQTRVRSMSDAELRENEWLVEAALGGDAEAMAQTGLAPGQAPGDEVYSAIVAELERRGAA